MGVVKGAAKHKGKKAVENATEDIPVVGDVVDSAVSSGPMDKAGDKLDKDRDRDRGKRR